MTPEGPGSSVRKCLCDRFRESIRTRWGHRNPAFADANVFETRCSGAAGVSRALASWSSRRLGLGAARRALFR